MSKGSSITGLGLSGNRDKEILLATFDENKSILISQQDKIGKCRQVTEFEKMDRLGSGSYGIVYQARDTRSGEIVAMKKLKVVKEKDGFPISCLREINILQQLNHPNIVNLKDVVVGKNLESIFLVLEFCEQDLAAVLENMDAPLSEPQVIIISFVSSRERNFDAISVIKSLSIDPIIHWVKEKKSDGVRSRRWNRNCITHQHIIAASVVANKVKCIVSQLLTGLSYLHQNYVVHSGLLPLELRVKKTSLNLQATAPNFLDRASTVLGLTDALQQELEVAVRAWVRHTSKKWFQEGLERLPHQWRKFIQLKGDYIEKVDLSTELDLKVSNLLLTAKGCLKIADFGLARRFGYPEQPMSPEVVTLWYRAPELLLMANSHTVAVDMWAAGCIFAELLLNKPFLPGQSEIHQMKLIINLLGTPNDQVWPGFSSLPIPQNFTFTQQSENKMKETFPDLSVFGIDLLNSLFAYDPKQRIKCEAALKHVYFRHQPLASSPDELPSFPNLRSEKKTENAEKNMNQLEEVLKSDAKGLC